jgi:AcrR family transcriptional regulator
MTPTRRYDAPRRAAQAEATRRRVLDSAVLEFTEFGYSATPVSRIAGRAGVSERLVYSTFGSKRGLLMALLEHFAPTPSTEFDADLDQAADPVTQLEIAVGFLSDYYAAAAGVLRITLPASAADEDLRQFVDAGENFRRLAQRPLVERWSRDGVLRTGLEEDEAATILWVMTSPEVYLKFITAGWNYEQIRDWLAASLRRDLFHS